MSKYKFSVTYIIPPLVQLVVTFVSLVVYESSITPFYYLYPFLFGLLSGLLVEMFIFLFIKRGNKSSILPKETKMSLLISVSILFFIFVCFKWIYLQNRFEAKFWLIYGMILSLIYIVPFFLIKNLFKGKIFVKKINRDFIVIMNLLTFVSIVTIPYFVLFKIIRTHTFDLNKIIIFSLTLILFVCIVLLNSVIVSIEEIVKSNKNNKDKSLNSSDYLHKGGP